MLFIGVSYLFSYTLWIAAWLLARGADTGDLLYNETFIRGVLFEGVLDPNTFALSLFSMCGVYGPLVAGVLATAIDRETSLRDLVERVVRARLPARWYLYALAILLVAGVLPFGLLQLIAGLEFRPELAYSEILVFLLIYLVFQLLTSGLEEVGWRGYLLEKVLPGRSIWDAGWLVGLVWAFWHLPVVVILFVQQGMVFVQILGSLVGFSIGIVGMSILLTWFYANTRSVFLAIIIHGSFNTVPLTVGMLFGSPYLAALASQLLLWAIVIMIVSKAEKAPR